MVNKWLKYISENNVIQEVTDVYKQEFIVWTHAAFQSIVTEQGTGFGEKYATLRLN